MRPSTYRITTLGCRVNHAESRDLESILLGRGLTPAVPGAPADLEVVHSCTVTNQAAAKSRHAVRRAARRAAAPRSPCGDGGDHPGNGDPAAGPTGGASGSGEGPPDCSPMVIVTGCYASTHRAEAAGLVGDSALVISHEHEEGRDDDQHPTSRGHGALPGGAGANTSTLVDRFAARVDRWLGRRARHPSIRPIAATGSGPRILPLPVVPVRSGAGVHQRAILRIQDGCDAHCSFCIIPKIRRTLRSKTVPDAIAEARRLVDLGHREIVLSGIFIGAYGHETALRRRQQRPDRAPLADLLDAVAGVPGLERLRISSMEPGDVDEVLLDAMVAHRPVVVPHLHLPLQSGSDAVLHRMNRQYGTTEYLEMLAMVEEALTEPGDPAGGLPPLPPALTTDIICGFPGESDDDFERTVALAQRAEFLHMHVFPFSPKRGTAAARWHDRVVPAAVKKDRVRRLIALEEDPDDGLAIRYRRRLAGRRERVILEQPVAGEAGVMTGRCDRYVPIHVRTDRPRGALVEVKVTGIDRDRTIGVADAVAMTLPVLH